MNPKVSLIMTVYNREQYLEEAIVSVHPQSMSNQSRSRQVQYAKASVERAIARRGLEKTYRLEVSADVKFTLRAR
jgi:hypothetical protein